MNFFNRFKKRINNFFDQDHLEFDYHPWRDWQILVIIFLFGEVVIFSSHYLFYQWSATTKERALEEQSTKNPIEEKTKLDQIYSRYQNKEKELEKIKQNPLNLADPSF